MKKSPDNKRVMINASGDVRAWIEARARHLNATISAVVVMAVRKEMEREAVKDRAAGSGTAA
jgi:hypothetical protein